MGGHWDQLLAKARKSAAKHTTLNYPRAPADTANDTKKIDKAMSLIKQGELSHAARVLMSRGLAPSTQATLDELTNPQLRPSRPAEVPNELDDFAPAQHVELDRDIFATTLRQTRRGLSGGI